MRAAFNALHFHRWNDSINFSHCDVVQGFNNMIELGKSIVMAGEWVANWTSTCHTSGLVVQKLGSLIETDDMVAGGIAAAKTAGRRA